MKTQRYDCIILSGYDEAKKYVVYATVVDKICSAVAQSMEFKPIVATSATPHPHAKMMQDQGCAKVINRVYHTQIQALGIFYVRDEGGHTAARC